MNVSLTKPISLERFTAFMLTLDSPQGDNRTNMDWDEYFRMAYEENDLTQMRYALEQGADANVDLYSDGNTLLYWAAHDGKLELMELLLQYGARVAQEPEGESTSVHVAVEHNRRDVLERLLAADGKTALNSFDYIDRTPLMLAVEAKNLEMAQLLIAAGADVNAHNTARIGDTALRIAAERGNSEMVTLLLPAGADPLIPGWMGITPYDKAQQRRSPEGLKVRELIEKVVWPNGVPNRKTYKRQR